MAVFSVNILAMKMKYKKYVNVVVYWLFMVVMQVEVLESLGKIKSNHNYSGFGIGVKIVVLIVCQFLMSYALCKAIA